MALVLPPTRVHPKCANLKILESALCAAIRIHDRSRGSLAEGRMKPRRPVKAARSLRGRYYREYSSKPSAPQRRIFGGHCAAPTSLPFPSTAGLGMLGIQLPAVRKQSTARSPRFPSPRLAKKLGATVYICSSHQSAKRLQNSAAVPVSWPPAPDSITFPSLSLAVAAWDERLSDGSGAHARLKLRHFTVSVGRRRVRGWPADSPRSPKTPAAFTKLPRPPIIEKFPTGKKSREATPAMIKSATPNSSRPYDVNGIKHYASQKM